MSYDLREKSEYEGEPYELYRAAYGVVDADIARWTTAPFEIFRNGEKYVPMTSDRDPVIASPSIDEATLNIEVPINSQIAAQYKLYPPAQPIQLNIWRGHVGEPADSEILVWTGRILWCSFDDPQGIATLECEPISLSMKRLGLRRHYQYMCSHVLYESNSCRADRFDPGNRFNSFVRAVSGNTVVIESITQDPANPRLVSGYLDWFVNDLLYSRTILAASIDGTATTLTLIGPTRGLKVGQDIEIVRGCNHTFSECRNQFQNTVNFGGMPWIPAENPGNKTKTFY